MLTAELNKFYPQENQSNSNSIATDFAQRGFAKKKESPEVFENILLQVNESSIREPVQMEKEVG